jgi:hypothetical protein
VDVSASTSAVRPSVEFAYARRVLALLAFLLLTAAFALWSASGVAQVCDPVTGEGCDTVPPSTDASSATTAPPTTQAPQTTQAPPTTLAPQTAPPPTQGPATTPAAPQTTQAAPTTAAPTPTTLAPATTAADEPSTKSGGGGVPWQLAAGVPAVLLGAAGLGAVVVAKKKSDPVAAYTNTCNDLCRLKQQEAQKQAEMDALQVQLNEIDDAWRQAREYLRNQLRADYIAHKQSALATTLLAASTPLSSLVSGVGFTLSIAMHGTRSQSYGYFSPAHWNKQVKDELISAQTLVDGIHDDKLREWRPKLADAKERLDDAVAARQKAQANLDSLRAQNPDTEFPPCECAR